MALPVRRGTDTDVARWEPLRELAELDARMNQFFESAFTTLTNRATALWSPAVDVEETDSAYVVEAELPGVKEHDVDVELINNVLSIHGEVKERERVGVLRRKTRRTGEFDYRMTLPADVDPDKVTATLRDGVLRVEVAKTEAAQPRRIQITQG